MALGQNLGRRVVWRVRRFLRRRRRSVYRHLYRDREGELSRSVVVAGAGRSGTTWLAEVLAAELDARIMFEPFQPEKVEEFRGYPRFLYRRPGDEDGRLEAFAARVLRGQIRDPWIDRQIDVLAPRYRVIKDIRACLFLRWLHERFPQVPILFIVRHPCAVVASRLRLGWDTDRDLQPFLEQDSLVEDHLRDHLSVMRTASTDEEKHALVWCISNLVPLRQFREGGMHLIFYEELCRRPQQELEIAFAALDRRPGERVLQTVAQASATSVGQSAVVTGEDPVFSWRRDLRRDQIDRVLAIVDQLGLGELYADGFSRPEAVGWLRSTRDRREVRV